MQSDTHGGGFFAWLAAGRRGFEAYLYVLHRVSGLALLLFLVAHVFVTSARLFGEATWERVMAMTHHPAMAFFEYLVYAAFVFHGLNGVRLILIELGLAVGKPERPVYPHRSSLDSQRILMIVLMIITAVLIALGGFDTLSFQG